MNEKKNKIDPNSRNYDFKKDIDVDPRFEVCQRELIISFGIFVLFAAVMLFVVFVVGGGNPREYSYIWGMPAWYFWVFVVCAATAVVVSVVLDKCFRHMSLEAEGELEE